MDGVYTTDPRVLPEACIVRQVCYDEMLELASLGAGVLHSRSVEFGKKFNVPIHVRSSLSDVPGSVIVDDSDTRNLAVSGAALTKDEALISVFDVPDVPGTIHKIFAPIADKKITVDMIVQNVSENGNTTVSFTVPRNEADDALEAVKTSIAELGGRIGQMDDEVSKVSVVGLGMAEQTGVANRMFRTLAQAGVNMEIITTSEIKISALVKRDSALNALRTVHSEFGLDKIESKVIDTESVRAPTNGISPADVIDRLKQDMGMESLMIDDISIDDTQSRITVSKIPNKPGIAAQLFDRIADAGVFVDMIVQSYASDKIADITFTMPRDQFDNALTVAQQVCEEFGCEKVDFKKSISKLSVSGVGLRSHTGVAIGMFRALSDAKINIEAINTSEVRVNVVVDSESGQSGIACLRNEFSRSMR